MLLSLIESPFSLSLGQHLYIIKKIQLKQHIPRDAFSNGPFECLPTSAFAVSFSLKTPSQFSSFFCLLLMPVSLIGVCNSPVCSPCPRHNMLVLASCSLCFQKYLFERQSKGVREWGRDRGEEQERRRERKGKKRKKKKICLPSFCFPFPPQIATTNRTGKSWSQRARNSTFISHVGGRNPSICAIFSFTH